MTHTQFLQLNKSLPLPEKMLQLAEFMVMEVEHKDGALFLYVKKRHKGEFCPSCNRFTNDHHSYRPKYRNVQDIPYSKPTYLVIQAERFDCPCGVRGITETYESINKGAHKTKRFEEYLQKNNHNSTFMHNATENNISVSSVYSKFMRWASKVFSPLAKHASDIRFPKILNIDDVSRKKGHKYMTAMADNTKKNSLT